MDQKWTQSFHKNIFTDPRPLLQRGLHTGTKTMKVFFTTYAVPLQLAAGLFVVLSTMLGISYVAFTYFPEETKEIKTKSCAVSIYRV